MRAIRLALLVLGVGGVGFGYWGAMTFSGHRVFHEWNVVVPMFVGLVGTSLLLLAGVLWLASRFLHSRRRENAAGRNQ